MRPLSKKSLRDSLHALRCANDIAAETPRQWVGLKLGCKDIRDIAGVESLDDRQHCLNFKIDIHDHRIDIALIDEPECLPRKSTGLITTAPLACNCRPMASASACPGSTTSRRLPRNSSNTTVNGGSIIDAPFNWRRSAHTYASEIQPDLNKIEEVLGELPITDSSTRAAVHRGLVD